VDIFELMRNTFLFLAFMAVMYIPYKIVMFVIRGAVKSTKKTYATLR